MGYIEAKFKKTSAGIYWSKIWKDFSWDILKQNLKRTSMGYIEVKFKKDFSWDILKQKKRLQLGHTEAKLKRLQWEFLKQSLKWFHWNIWNRIWKVLIKHKIKLYKSVIKSFSDAFKMLKWRKQMKRFQIRLALSSICPESQREAPAKDKSCVNWEVRRLLTFWPYSCLACLVCNAM